MISSAPHSSKVHSHKHSCLENCPTNKSEIAALATFITGFALTILVVISFFPGTGALYRFVDPSIGVALIAAGVFVMGFADIWITGFPFGARESK